MHCIVGYPQLWRCTSLVHIYFVYRETISMSCVHYCCSIAQPLFRHHCFDVWLKIDVWYMIYIAWMQSWSLDRFVLLIPLQTSRAFPASCLSPSSFLTKVSMVTGVRGVSTFLSSSWEGGGTRRVILWETKLTCVRVRAVYKWADDCGFTYLGVFAKPSLTFTMASFDMS